MRATVLELFKQSLFTFIFKLTSLTEFHAVLPDIVASEERVIAGIRRQISLSNHRVEELWKDFGPRRKLLNPKYPNEVISASIYPKGYFEDFQPSTPFEKWAGVEVSAEEVLPEEFETLTIPKGLYAVFRYKGSSGNPAIFQYIFTQWLPASGYALDQRPHIEVLGDQYRNNDPLSEEDIWIPIRLK